MGTNCLETIKNDKENDLKVFFILMITYKKLWYIINKNNIKDWYGLPNLDKVSSVNIMIWR